MKKDSPPVFVTGCAITTFALAVLVYLLHFGDSVFVGGFIFAVILWAYVYNSTRKKTRMIF